MLTGLKLRSDGCLLFSWGSVVIRDLCD
jgi:hypothetical protein